MRDRPRDPGLRVGDGAVVDSRNGDLYPTRQAANEAGVPELDIVEVRGSKRAVGRLRMAARHQGARRKARRRTQKASRQGNR